MTDLQEQLRARLDRLVAHIRRELAPSLDVVLAYAGEVEDPNPWRELSEAERKAQSQAWVEQAQRPPPGLRQWWGSMPWLPEQLSGYAIPPGNNSWPTGIPLPLAIGLAIDLVDAGAADLAARTADEIEHAATTFGVNSRMLPRMARTWPWPKHVPTAHVLLLLLDAVATKPEGEPLRDADDAAKPEDEPHFDITKWPRPALTRETSGLYPEFGWLDDDELLKVGNSLSYTPDGIRLLYHAEQLCRSPEYAAAYAWRRMAEIAAGDDPAPAHRLAVDAALAKENDELARYAASDGKTRDRLARLVLDHLKKLRRAVSMDGEPPTGCDALDIDGEILRWDAAAAAYLSRHFGATGKDLASTLRERAGERRAETTAASLFPAPGRIWSWWVDDTDDGAHRVAWALARTVWRETVRPDVEEDRQRARARHPGVTLSLLDAIQPAMAPGGSLEAGTMVDRHGVVVAKLDSEWAPRIPVVELAALDALIREGVGLLGSLTSRRLLLWVIRAAHERALDGDPDARVLSATGWGDLASMVGCTSRRHTTDIRRICLAFDALPFSLPGGGRGRLFTVHERPRKLVELTVNPPLMPHYGYTLAKRDRFIVPLTELPPMVGREREHGALAGLHIETLSELRRRAPELVTDGGVLVSPVRWTELAERTGVPDQTLPRALERWTQDGDDGPAFLDLVERDRYRLGKAHEDAHLFLLDAGGRSIQGKRDGERSARLRERRGRKPGKKGD